MAASCDKAVSFPTNDRIWYKFIVWSLIIYVGGIILILIGRSTNWIFCYKKKSQISTTYNSDEGTDEPDEDDEELEQGLYLTFKEGAASLISGHSVQGRVIVSYLNNLKKVGMQVVNNLFISTHNYKRIHTEVY